MPLVFADVIRERLTVLNFVQAFDEFFRKRLDPLDVLFLDCDECVTDGGLPIGDDVDVGRVFVDYFGCEAFDGLEFFELLLVLFVDILEVFARDETLKTLVLLFNSRIESCWRVVLYAVDPECAFRELL